MAGDEADGRADIALVVVHGIGEQARGATLLAWAEPLARRLDRIARKSGGSGVRITRSRLTEGDQPSEIELAVDRGEFGVRRIALSEARWAESFLTVAPVEVLAWGRSFLWRAGGRFLRHLGRSASTSWALTRERAAQFRLLIRVPGLRHVPNVVAVLVLASVLLPVLPALVIAVSALGALLVGALAALTTVATVLLAVATRIPLLGKALRGLTTGLVTSVGDATAWTRHPILAAAMRDRVRDEVARVRGRARTVVLLGHSQGAAVCADTVLYPQDGDAAVDVLVTVGGAVGLLGRSVWSRGRSTGTGPVAAWAGRDDLDWINIWAGWDPVPSGPVADSAAASRQRWREAYVEDFERRRRQTYRVRSSVDRVSLLVRNRLSAVPEPAAPEEPDVDRFPVREAPGPAEWQVHNRASIATDHTTYTANVPQVIDPIARLLLTGRTGDEGRWAGRHPLLTATAATHVNAVRVLGDQRRSAVERQRLTRAAVARPAILAGHGPDRAGRFADLPGAARRRSRAVPLVDRRPGLGPTPACERTRGVRLSGRADRISDGLRRRGHRQRERPRLAGVAGGRARHRDGLRTAVGRPAARTLPPRRTLNPAPAPPAGTP